MRQVYARQSVAHPDIKMVQGTGLNADQNLVFSGLWIGDIFVPQNFRPTEFVQTNSFHACGSSEIKTRTVANPIAHHIEIRDNPFKMPQPAQVLLRCKEPRIYDPGLSFL